MAAEQGWPLTTAALAQHCVVAAVDAANRWADGTVVLRPLALAAKYPPAGAGGAASGAGSPGNLFGKAPLGETGRGCDSCTCSGKANQLHLCSSLQCTMRSARCRHISALHFCLQIHLKPLSSNRIRSKPTLQFCCGGLRSCKERAREFRIVTGRPASGRPCAEHHAAGPDAGGGRDAQAGRYQDLLAPCRQAPGRRQRPAGRKALSDGWSPL